VKPRPLGVGVVGLGNAAQHHLPALLSLPEVRVLAFADLDPQRLKSRSEHFRVKAAFGDYRKLLEHPGIDVVAILTPPGSHLEIAMAAMEAGKHILLEKPIAARLDEANILCERARRFPGKVCVAYNLRFLPQVQRIRQLVGSGRLGSIEILRCFASSPRMLGLEPPAHRGDRAQGGGSVIELGVHHYDLWSYLLGSSVADMTAVSRNVFMHDQSAVVTARMSCGTLATTCLSLCAAEQYEVEILGSAARARGSLYQYDGLEVLETGAMAGDFRVRAAGLGRAIAGFPNALRALRHAGIFRESFRGLWRHLISCIREDREPEPDLKAGFDSLAAAVAASEAALQSAEFPVSGLPRR
jgi:predicted dehydrogenase